jgi:hypothetical protein
MRIATVEYRRLRSFGNYENECIGATAEVGTNETAYEALSHLKAWVNEKLADTEREVEGRRRDENERWEASQELRELRQQIADAREVWEKARAFLASHGLDSPEAIPF